jgi:hypothetical protein
MKVRIQVIVESDHGETECIEEVAQFERGELRPEALGMTLAEAKALLQSVQQTMVTEQTTAHLEAHRPCPACQAPRRYKGHHQLVYRTVFGRLTLPSPRWYLCQCQMTEPRSFSPLAELLQEHTAPELLYLEAKFAALMSYGVTVDVLGELLPIGAQLNATTVQRHLLRVAERMEHEMGEEQAMFIEGCPAEWEDLPAPDAPLTVGLDGGYVHARDEQRRKAGWFEVIVGKSLPAGGGPPGWPRPGVSLRCARPRDRPVDHAPGGAAQGTGEADAGQVEATARASGLGAARARDRPRLSRSPRSTRGARERQRPLVSGSPHDSGADSVHSPGTLSPARL